MERFTVRMAAQCLLIGIVAGLRSMTAPAAVAAGLARRRDQLPPSRFLRGFASSRSQLFTTLNSLGEYAADQLPSIPARTALPSLIARSLSGSFCGATIALSYSSAPILGGFFGLIGALIGAFGGYHARKWIGKQTKLPDSLIGLAEDGIAAGLGRLAVE